jgi:hypothetical protein
VAKEKVAMTRRRAMDVQAILYKRYLQRKCFGCFRVLRDVAVQVWR